jgi:hypothetical protein
MTPQEIQEINDHMAEIMGWHKDQDGRVWLDSNNESTGFVSYQLCDNDEVFGPMYDANHAFMVLHKWLNDHPEYIPTLGWYHDGDGCYLELNDMDESIFIGTAPQDHESQAICNCLMQAKEVKK